MIEKRGRKRNKHVYKSGPILYWMQREHRVNDNWALLFAQKLAHENNVPLYIVFCLREKFNNSNKRILSFMIKGLKDLEKTCEKFNIPFNIIIGNPETEIVKYINEENIGAIITEFNPLKTERKWRDVISQSISIPFYEVDARNIVPCWIASPKQEFAAYTFRPKITSFLSTYLENYPPVQKQNGHFHPFGQPLPKILNSLKFEKNVAESNMFSPGEKEAEKVLSQFFVSSFQDYHLHRNDPTKSVTSTLSPYLHFGHISSQRIALEVIKSHKNASQDSFLEELIVRRELADNYCYYNKYYDSFEGFPSWAQKTLHDHIYDKREHLYTLSQLEKAQTHDPLWNAAMKQALLTGYMHGYMRMYWAKKILEWSPNPGVAQENAIILMDTYFLDGRESSGFTGIAWAIGGVHDRAWFEREIFGKIRYMNFNGAKRKFDTEAYIQKFR